MSSVKVHQYKQWSNHDPWYKISVTHEEQAQNFFFHHYVMCESGQTQTNPDCHGIIYKRATEPGYLANLVNAVGLKITLNSNDNSSSWNRHVDGALALIRLRGASQLRNRVGRGIFLHLRTEILIDCLQRRLQVPTILVNSMAEARNYESAQEAPAARLANIVVNICDLLSSAKKDTTNKTNLSCYISRLLSIDTDLEDWTKTLPAEYKYTALTSPAGMGDAEVFMGRYDGYSNRDFAHTWNLQRCTRIVLRQTLIEAISKHFHTPSSPSMVPSLPLSYEHLFHTSNTIIQKSSVEICSSVLYILHSGGTAHTASHTLRNWVLSIMERAESVTGIQKAKLIASTIRRSL
ncbi:unnamed protein product [Fusarium venenatum]|uniref:Uncharacterized protein n=1 Tax=Fusarium venenatum TaxID=56646 RepID=A0A2L2SUM7_9HYPO|nr:uncharacterized protein FVRRES_04365 [Fusarium venenatum]CEI59929.1 unnamed protein product [Fusarium venenatum]